jgi:hypothetical protein
MFQVLSGADKIKNRHGNPGGFVCINLNQELLKLNANGPFVNLQPDYCCSLVYLSSSSLLPLKESMSATEK